MGGKAGAKRSRPAKRCVKGDERLIVMGFDGNSGRSFHQRAVSNGRHKLIHNHGILADDPPGRFAELDDGPPEPKKAFCPLCGKDFTLLSGDAFGCPVHGIQAPVSKGGAPDAV